MASMAGRAPLGGPRELALGCFLVARIVRDTAAAPNGLTPDQIHFRVQGAKQWLGAAAIPAAARNSLARLVEASATRDRTTVLGALEVVMTVTANQLDQGARLELERLAQAIAG
jgi:hypothetical protein